MKAKKFTPHEVKQAAENRLAEIQDDMWQELLFIVEKTDLTAPAIDVLTDNLIAKACRYVADALITETTKNFLNKTQI